MLKIPFFKQKKNYTCGPAVLKMVFSAFNVKCKEAELAKLGKTNQNGTDNHGLIYTARKHGFYCYVHEHASINQLKHFLGLNLPVIVNYIEPSHEEGHYALIIGYDKKHIIMHDPWHGPRFRLPYTEFEKRWHGKYANKNSRRWLLVLSKNPFNIGKQYDPY